MIAFNGSTPLAPGNTQIKLQSKAIAEPISMVIGNSDLWFDVPNINLAICGTANPINAIGPQKAQVIAVISPAQSRRRKRINFIFTPKFAAYLSPNSRAFKGLISRIERSKLTQTTMQ